MRSIIFNRLLSFQYRLGRIIGRKKAMHICFVLEKCFVTVFGRERYRPEE